jgi:AcrR family transcriptional regulator
MIKLIAKARPSGKTRADGDVTKQRMIEAALQTLRDEGYSGATARRIAARGEFNAPLIFYHFGGVEPLLLAALAVASERRLQRYRDALDKAENLGQLVEVLAGLWKGDGESAEIAAIQELVAAPEFATTRAAEIAELLDPWFAYAEGVTERLISGTPVAAIIGPREAAFAVVALLMGLEKLGRLDPGGARTMALFDAARGAAPLLGHFLGSPTPRSRHSQMQRIELD